MIIDIHACLGRQSGRKLSSATLQTCAAACGIDQILLSNLDITPAAGGGLDVDETDANVATLAVCAICRQLLPLYWARPGRVDSHAHAFAGALASEPFVGAVFSPASPDPGAEIDTALLQPYFSVAAKRGIPVLVHVAPGGHTTVEKAITLAGRHAGLPVVLSGAGPDRLWLQAVDEVHRTVSRSDVCVYLDTSRVHPGDVLVAVEAIGAKRVLFGSGGTLLDEGHAQRCRSLLDDLRNTLTPEDFAKVAGGNARELFGIAGKAAS